MKKCGICHDEVNDALLVKSPFVKDGKQVELLVCGPCRNIGIWNQGNKHRVEVKGHRKGQGETSE